MDNGFEEIRKKIESADLVDIAPSFDKEEAWDELSSRLEKKRSKRGFIWWYAAAALLVLLIGGKLLQFNSNNDTVNTTPYVKSTNRSNSIVTIINTDTNKSIKKPTSTIPKVATTKQVQKTITVNKPVEVKVAKTEKVALKEPADSPKQTEPIKIAIAKPAQRKVKPIHLLDIENEDRKTALYNNDPSAKSRSGFVLQIPASRLPNRNIDQSTSLLNSLKK